MDNKELQRMVSKFNKRVERMYNYSEGSLASLDELRQQLYMLTGKESEVPKVSLKGMGAEDRVKLVGIMNTYFNNPESTIKSYEAMQNKSISTYANNRDMTASQIVAFNTLVKSSEFAKLKELIYKDSKGRMDSVDTMLSGGLSGKQAIDIISNWISNGQIVTFKKYVDGISYGLENGLDVIKSNTIVDHWSRKSMNISLDNYIDYVAYSYKHGDSTEKGEDNIRKWVDSQKDKKQSETIPFREWVDNAVYNEGQKS